ncbi:MAG: tetratricopeptide repeat protein [Elusimicrobia bacterium]|nr:tetratricopeptide repeat protein [Elusimicrobiota bacterium]
MRNPPRISALAALLLCLTMPGLADDKQEQLAALQSNIEIVEDALTIAKSDGAKTLLRNELKGLEAQRRKLNGEPEPQPQPAATPEKAPKTDTPASKPDAPETPTDPAAAAGEAALARADAVEKSGAGSGWGAADPFINRALQQDPNNPAANTAAAKSALAKGDFAGARKFADKALKSDPGNSQAMGARALANNALGERAAALSDAKSVLKVSPEDKTAKSLVSLLAPQALPKDAGRAKDARFDQAGDPGALGGAAAGPAPGARAGPGPGAAAEVGTSSADRYKAAALTEAAAAKLRLGDADGAAQAATAAMGSGASGPEPLILRGKALDAAGRHEDAVQDETAALEKEMDAALAALMERAWSQARSGRAPEARADARAAARLAPEGSPALGLARSIAARPEAVGSPAGPAEPAPPEVPSLYAGISPQSLDVARQARERLAVGDTREALRLAARAVSLDRGNHLAFIVSAAAYRVQGRYDEAIAAATEALRLQPRAADALLARSLAYLHLKDWGRSEADASAAIAVGGERIEAFRQRLLARRQLGDAAGSAADERRIAALEQAGRPLRGPSRARPLAVGLALGGVLAGLAVWRLRQFRRPPEPPTYS